MPEVMGAGVPLFDYDNDGDLDVFLVQGGPLDPLGRPPRTAPRRTTEPAVPQRSGRGGGRTPFTDVTEAPAALQRYGMGAAVGDYDNDGDLDLFVTSFGPDTLFRNNGDGTFTDVTAQAGVSDRSGARAPRSSTTIATAISICSSPTTWTSRSRQQGVPRRRGARLLQPACLPPVPDRLYRNEGTARSDVTEAAGISKADGAGSASPSATTTATAGSTSTSPTTRRRISSGSTSATARSWTKGCCRDRR